MEIIKSIEFSCPKCDYKFEVKWIKIIKKRIICPNPKCKEPLQFSEEEYRILYLKTRMLEKLENGNINL